MTIKYPAQIGAEIPPAVTKIKVCITTEIDTRWISRPLIFCSSFSNSGDEKRKFIVTLPLLAKYSFA
jgi:hypothetical protein